METTKTSIYRKIIMALSGLFLLIFLLQHFIINSLSVISPDAFNEASHFMGTNPIVQFLAQPILIFGVVIHFIMGVVIEMQNRAARPQKYAYSKPSANSSWFSRNMIISGVVVVLFLLLHFYDFWIPEIKTKFIDGDMSGTMAGVEGYRYFTELQHKFTSPVRMGIYILAFVFLAFHLNHGFSSAFQTVGFNNKYTPAIKKFAVAYSFLIPLGFIFIAIFHFINSSH